MAEHTGATGGEETDAEKNNSLPPSGGLSNIGEILQAKKLERDSISGGSGGRKERGKGGKSKKTDAVISKPRYTKEEEAGFEASRKAALKAERHKLYTLGGYHFGEAAIHDEANRENIAFDEERRKQIEADEAKKKADEAKKRGAGSPTNKGGGGTKNKSPEPEADPELEKLASEKRRKIAEQRRVRESDSRELDDLLPKLYQSYKEAIGRGEKIGRHTNPELFDKIAGLEGSLLSNGESIKKLDNRRHTVAKFLDIEDWSQYVGSENKGQLKRELGAIKKNSPEEKEKIALYKTEFSEKLGAIFDKIKEDAAAGGDQPTTLKDNEEINQLENEALGIGLSPKEIADWRMQVAKKKGFDLKKIPRSEPVRSVPSPKVSSVPPAPISGEIVTPEVARHKEMLLEAIRTVEEHPLNDDGKLRNPLNYPKFVASKKALLEGRMTSTDVAKLDIKILEDAGLDLVEWRKGLLEKGAAGEKKVSLDSREAGRLEFELERALVYAISAAQAAAKKGEDPADPLDDPEVKAIEDRIRRTIDPGDGSLDALILATENATLASKRFVFGELKAQAEAVREGKSKASLDEILEQKQEGARAAKERLTRDADDDSSEAISVGKGGRQSMHRATGTVDADSPEAQRVRDKAASKLARKLGLSPRTGGEKNLREIVTATEPEMPENADSLRGEVIDAYVAYLRESQAATNENHRVDEAVIAAANRLQIEAIKAGMNTDELWQVAKEQLKDKEEVGKTVVEAEAPAIETVEPLIDLPRNEAAAWEKLEKAREWLAQVERNSAMGVRELAEATERYDKARAEYVAGDIRKFVLEQTALFEKRAEITGSFEKIRRGWKWLGEMNLTKLGAKPGGFWSGMVYRGVNIRSVASGGLLGLGVLTPVGWFALGTRQVMSGVGTGFLAYEMLRRKHEAKLTKLADEEVSGLMHGEAAERMIQLAAYARANHTWEAVRPAYEKLQKRYEKDLEDVKDWLQLSPDGTKDFTEAVRKEQTTLTKKERDKEKTRRFLGVAAGAAAFFGVPLVRRWLGYKDIAEAASGSRGSGLSASEAVRSKMEQLPETTSDLPPVHEGAFPPEAVGTLPPVHEGMPQPVESLENIQEFKITVKPGEGPIHEARKAIALYLDKKGASLGQAERIWAEEELWKRTKKTLETAGQLKKVYHPGDSIGFQRSEIDSVIGEVKARFGAPEKAAALSKNLKQFIDNVKWDRYKIIEGKGLWEADGGIRKIVKIPVKALTGEAVDTNALREAWEKAEEVRNLGVTIVAPEEVHISNDMIEVTLNQSLVENVVATTAENAATEAVAGAAAEGVDEAKTAAAEIAAEIPETVARQVSALRKEYYDLIKNMEVSELVKKRFLSFTKEQQWPLPKVDGEYSWVSNKPSHVRLMQYTRFQNRVREALAELSPSEAEGAKAMPVSKFIMKYLIAK